MVCTKTSNFFNVQKDPVSTGQINYHNNVFVLIKVFVEVWDHSNYDFASSYEAYIVIFKLFVHYKVAIQGYGTRIWFISYSISKW